MKVERPGIKGAAGAYTTGAVRAATPGAVGDGPSAVAPVDSLTVSQKAKEAARLRTLLRTSPEMRMALVERIKAQVEAGEYRVAPADVADRLLKSKVLD